MTVEIGDKSFSSSGYAGGLAETMLDRNLENVRLTESSGVILLLTFAQPGNTDVGKNRTFWCLYNLRTSISRWGW